MLPPPSMTPSAVAISTPSPVIPGGPAGVTVSATGGVLPNAAAFQPSAIYAATVPQIGTMPQHPTAQNIMQTAPPAAAPALAPPMATIPGLTHLPPRQVAPYAGYQPLLYWYPSPPVSPQSAAYYVQSNCSTTMMMKGLPYTSQPSDMMAYLDGVCDVEKQ